MQSEIHLNSGTAFIGHSCQEIILIIRYALLAEIQKFSHSTHSSKYFHPSCDCQVRSHKSSIFNSAFKHGSVRRHKCLKYCKSLKKYEWKTNVDSISWQYRRFWPCGCSAHLYMKTHFGWKKRNREKTAERHQAPSL